MELEDQVLRIVRSILGVENIELGTMLKDNSAWDSLKQAEILISIEELFDVILSADQMENFSSARDLVAVLRVFGK